MQESQHNNYLAFMTWSETAAYSIPLVNSIQGYVYLFMTASVKAVAEQRQGDW